MNYDEAVAWLYATQMHGIKLGLENISRLAAELGLHTSGGAAPKFLHVAGTNGKGSVCAMLDAICRAGGLKTGLFTSPHLVTFRERIRVDGQTIAESEVARGLNQIRTLTERWDHAPTFFEIATALALAHFQQHECDVVVLETGMGGRLDATSVVRPAVCALTSIALDHQQWLGATIEEIAREKAGIFKANVPALSAPQAPEVAAVLRDCAAAAKSSRLDFVETPWTSSPVNLAGTHQLWNAALAVSALECAGFTLDRGAVSRGLAEVQWPGRFQRIGERIVLDGAHNPAAAAQLASTWREVFGGDHATLILGVLRDKDARGIGAALLPIAARVITIAVQNPRSSEPAELRAVLRDLAKRIDCTVAPDLARAIAAAETHPDRVLICGSLFLAGEALAHFETQPRPEISLQ